MHAQQLTREHGYEPTYVAYPTETTVGIYLQRIVIMGVNGNEALGKEILRQAYLTGDFNEVRRITNRVLRDPSAFDTLMSKSNGTEALNYLTGRLDAACIEYSRWNENPIAMAASLQLLVR